MFKNTDIHSYDDILEISHHVSSRHPRMSAVDRAAQFAPFSALTGYGAAVMETERLTEPQVELDEEQKAQIDRCLHLLAACLYDDPPAVRITYFLPDERKEGGSYPCVEGKVCAIDEIEHTVIMADQTVIPIERIRRIDSDGFDEMDAL